MNAAHLIHDLPVIPPPANGAEPTAGDALRNAVKPVDCFRLTICGHTSNPLPVDASRRWIQREVDRLMAAAASERMRESLNRMAREALT